MATYECKVCGMSVNATCGKCGAIHNLAQKPMKVAGMCDACGGELYQRDDDSPETVQFRLYTYYKETSPLIGYYYAKDLLVEVDGRKLDIALADNLRLRVAAISQLAAPAEPHAALVLQGRQDADREAARCRTFLLRHGDAIGNDDESSVSLFSHDCHSGLQ